MGVHLDYYKFQELDDAGDKRHGAYGYMLYGDSGEFHNDRFESFEELRDVVNEDTLIAFLFDHHRLMFTKEVEDRGIHFNGRWIDWTELKEKDNGLFKRAGRDALRTDKYRYS